MRVTRTLVGLAVTTAVGTALASGAGAGPLLAGPTRPDAQADLCAAWSARVDGLIARRWRQCSGSPGWTTGKGPEICRQANR